MKKYTMKSLIGTVQSAYPSRMCNCVGPQDGQPVCPCRMSGVKIVDGRYVEIRDLGPAPEAQK